jgi:sortase A
VIAVAVTATVFALGAPAPAPPAAAGAPFATLEIPSIGLRALVREGVSTDVLDAGPGHYPGTRAPGRGGKIGIAGHRVSHSRPFLRINELRRGQPIFLTRSSRRYVYRVFAMRVVAPRDDSVLRQTLAETLVLTTCHPPRSDRTRLVVFAWRVGALT